MGFSRIPSVVYSSLFSCLLAFVLLINFGLDSFGLHLIFGVIISSILTTDTVEWLRGRLDTFDPGALLGIVGVFLYLISPVSQHAWDFWPYLPALSGDKSWIDFWSFLSLIGVVLYKFATKVKVGGSGSSSGIYINKKLFCFVFPVFIVLSAVTQLYIYSIFGGISGFISAFTIRQELGVADYDPFSGMGLPMLFAESFKYLIAIYLFYIIKDKPWAGKKSAFLLVMLAFLILFILFGGLRGSRSSTLFSLVFAAGIYHFGVREISKKIVALGIIFSVLFAITYYWYKIGGLSGFSAMTDTSARQELHDTRQDPIKYLISRDMGRMDMQTLALKKIVLGEQPISWGRTYAASVFASVPKSIIPYDPAQITKEKTELIHGTNTYIHGGARQTTLVLGQPGEALVNFGILGMMAFYFLLGVLVKKVRIKIKTAKRGDVSLYLLPFFCLLPILLLITDMNVVIMQTVRYLLVPSIALLLCLRFPSSGNKRVRAYSY